MARIPKRAVRNAAYIDAANLYRNIVTSGWRLDYRRFRAWLWDKYNVSAAYIFLGFLPENRNFYAYLKKTGYILIFREVSYAPDGKIKGNCDTDLVLKVAQDFYEHRFGRAVIVSSDGDYAGLIRFLKKKNALRVLISPSDKCSNLLRKIGIPITFISSKRKLLERGKK